MSNSPVFRQPSNGRFSLNLATICESMFPRNCRKENFPFRGQLPQNLKIEGCQTRICIPYSYQLAATYIYRGETHWTVYFHVAVQEPGSFQTPVTFLYDLFTVSELQGVNFPIFRIFAYIFPLENVQNVHFCVRPIQHTWWPKKTGPACFIANILKTPRPNCVEVGEILQCWTQ